MAAKRWRNIYVRSEPSTPIVYWRGGWFAPITVEKLTAIPTSAVVVQGGISFAGPSALTHAGIGAGDLSVRHFHNKDEVWRQCKDLWNVDIIPCPRGFVADSFQGRTVGNMTDGNEHIHFLDLDCVKFMHPQAQAQVKEILDGGDGLLGNAHYTGPSLSNRRSWSTYPLNPVNVRKKELELPTTAEVVKALTNDKTFVKTIAEAVLNADVIDNVWPDKDADPKKKDSKPNPQISLKTSAKRSDSQSIKNGQAIAELISLVEARFPEQPSGDAKPAA